MSMFAELLSCQCYMMVCSCPNDERALRAYSKGREPLARMTPGQRQWCLDQIGSVEYHGPIITITPKAQAKEHENDTDGELAEAVLAAWDKYRDKGLL